jgi:hypothetical protein
MRDANPKPGAEIALHLTDEVKRSR